IILVYDDDTNTRAYTADHIWPRSFGGNSTAENLLPACGECNQKHKSDFASWAMTGIQSVILGINPPPDDLRRIAGVHRFALHHRQAQILAISERLSLRDAYLRIGPSSDPRTVNARDSAHFFNLTNTDVE
ncbi:MAG: HNH endonuclease, partial [Planctomycetota bacterium]|nr:HNH endonuclease [Planctomycetota bacterium]